MKNPLRLHATILALILPFTLRADPLHPIAHDAYWHHDSGFVFPATLAGFARVGAPQERDGTSTIVAYYASGIGAGRLVVELALGPRSDERGANEAGATPPFQTVERAGWRLVLNASPTDAQAQERIEALWRALPIGQLGTIDARCPNAGCGD